MFVLLKNWENIYFVQFILTNRVITLSKRPAYFYFGAINMMGFLVARIAKNLPAIQETRVWSLGWEGPLEKEMATHCNISCLGNPIDRGARWATVHGVMKESDMAEWLNNHKVNVMVASLAVNGWCSFCLFPE